MAQLFPEGQENDPNTQIKYLLENEQLELQNSAYTILQKDNSPIREQADLDESRSCADMLIGALEEKDVEVDRLDKLLPMENKEQESVPVDKNEGIIAPIGGASEKTDCKLHEQEVHEMKRSEMEMKALYDQKGKAIVVPTEGTAEENQSIVTPFELEDMSGENQAIVAPFEFEYMSEENQDELFLDANNFLDRSGLSEIMHARAQAESDFHDFQMMDDELQGKNQKQHELAQRLEILTELKNKLEQRVEILTEMAKQSLAQLEFQTLDSFNSNEEELQKDEIPIPISKMIKKGRFGDRCFETGSSSKPHSESEPCEVLKIEETGKPKPVWSSKSEMVSNLPKNPEMLLEAVCALYRLDKSCKLMGVDGRGLRPEHVECVSMLVEELRIKRTPNQTGSWGSERTGKKDA